MLNLKFRLYPTREQEARERELKEQQPILRNYHSKMLQMISTKVAAARSALEELKKCRYQSGNGKLQLLKEGECYSFTYNQSWFKIEQNIDGYCLQR